MVVIKVKMKYFQGLADISRFLERVIEDKTVERRHVPLNSLSKHWGYGDVTLEEVQADLDAVKYIFHLHRGLAFHDTGKHKPTQERVKVAFERVLIYIESVQGVHAYNVNKKGTNPIVKKEYLACRHYIFKFSLQAWYDKLPDYVQSFDEKYKDTEW